MSKKMKTSSVRLVLEEIDARDFAYSYCDEDAPVKAYKPKKKKKSTQKAPVKESTHQIPLTHPQDEKNYELEEPFEVLESWEDALDSLDARISKLEEKKAAGKNQANTPATAKVPHITTK